MRAESLYYNKETNVLVSIPVGHLANKLTYVTEIVEAVKQAFKGATVIHFTTPEIAENVPPTIIVAAKDNV